MNLPAALPPSVDEAGVIQKALVDVDAPDSIAELTQNELGVVLPQQKTAGRVAMIGHFLQFLVAKAQIIVQDGPDVAFCQDLAAFILDLLLKIGHLLQTTLLRDNIVALIENRTQLILSGLLLLLMQQQKIIFLLVLRQQRVHKVQLDVELNGCLRATQFRNQHVVNYAADLSSGQHALRDLLIYLRTAASFEAFKPDVFSVLFILGIIAAVEVRDRVVLLFNSFFLGVLLNFGHFVRSFEEELADHRRLLPIFQQNLRTQPLVIEIQVQLVLLELEGREHHLSWAFLRVG